MRRVAFDQFTPADFADEFTVLRRNFAVDGDDVRVPSVFCTRTRSGFKLLADYFKNLLQGWWRHLANGFADQGLMNSD